uniref:Uncharacterized protein n=1 Tax=Anguilla anguilla TaxID=7936 RepID=A0A0E9Q2B9_ANGAN
MQRGVHLTVFIALKFNTVRQFNTIPC